MFWRRGFVVLVASMTCAAPSLRPGARKLASVTPDILSCATDGVLPPGLVLPAASMHAGAAPMTIILPRATLKRKASILDSIGAFTECPAAH